MPLMQLVFIALRFLATGCFYSTTAEHHGVSEASICCIVHRVMDILTNIKDDHMKWPTLPEDVNHCQWDFFTLSGFPGAISAVDCTHVPLDCCPLGQNKHVYVNHKGVHNINVQLICDSRI